MQVRWSLAGESTTVFFNHAPLLATDSFRFSCGPAWKWREAWLGSAAERKRVKTNADRQASKHRFRVYYYYHYYYISGNLPFQAINLLASPSAINDVHIITELPGIRARRTDFRACPRKCQGQEKITRSTQKCRKKLTHRHNCPLCSFVSLTKNLLYPTLPRLLLLLRNSPSKPVIYFTSSPFSSQIAPTCR